MFWILLCLVVVLYWIRERLPGEPPMYPGEIPIIGHLHRFINNEDVLDFMKKCSKFCYEHDGVVKVKIGTRTLYGVADPDDCYTVANSCLYKHITYFFPKKWLGDSLLCGKVSVWKRHRKLLNPAFNQQVLDNFINVFNEQARKLVSDTANEDGKGPFEHFKYMRRNALESICLTTMGIDLNKSSTMNDQYENAVEEMYSIYMERLLKPWLLIEMIYKKSNLRNKEDEVIKILHNFSNLVCLIWLVTVEGGVGDEIKDVFTSRFGVNMVLQEKKAQRRAAENEDIKRNEKFKPFIDLLLDFENGIFTDQEIREEVDNMIVTGHDTTASTLTVALLLIGTHPEVQDRIVEEINTVLSENNNDVEKQDLHKLVYLEAVLKETMRLYPIAPTIARWIDKKLKLKNYTLPANADCVLMVYAVNRHPVWGADAEVFKPERWLSPTTLPKNLNAFMSFSIGKRNCFGKAYAMMSMKTTLVHFLRRYRVTADINKTVFKLEVLLKIDSGGEISIRSR